jgi:F-type H+-transporting ATPase subunit alpha
VNAGISVSRVGGAAQTKIMKKLSGGIRIALAQYRELAAFAQFASDLDDATRKQLERGQRVTELMKQKQYAPMSVAEQSLSIYAVDKGYMDDVAINKIGAFEAALHAHFANNLGDVLAKINESGDWNDAFEASFKQGIQDFKSTGTW